MFYRIVLCFIEASWIDGDQSRYVLWKISQKKNESEYSKNTLQKPANKKMTRDKKSAEINREGNRSCGNACEHVRREVQWRRDWLPDRPSRDISWLLPT